MTAQKNGARKSARGAISLPACEFQAGERVIFSWGGATVRPEYLWSGTIPIVVDPVLPTTTSETADLGPCASEQQKSKGEMR